MSLNDKWKNKILKTLGQNYKKAANFEITFSIVENIINSESRFLIELHIKSFELINKYLGITTIIVDSSTIYNNQGLKGQDRILDICIQENTDHYINPFGGQKLYDKKSFFNNDIELKFLKSKEINYSQFNKEFIPSLSIIDVMMYNSKKEINKMLDEYELL
jgi:hypothetical protein